MLRSKSFWCHTLLAIGVLCSLAMVLAFPEFYHHRDMSTFLKWARYWSKGWRNIYVNCDTCNYPMVGMLSSAGLLALLGGDDQKAVLTYRILLAIIDGVNVLLIFGLFKKLSIPNAAGWAGLIGVLCFGNALWGQIDGVSQLFILLTLFWVVRNNLKTDTPKHFWLYLLVSSILWSCALLTKQLTVFSLFSLGLLLITWVFFSAPKWQSAALALLLIAACCAGCVFIWDLFLRLEPPYLSHLYYIFKTGSDHGDELARNGFNLWIFLGERMRSSSHIPLVAAAPFLTPYNVGMALFMLFNVILGWSQFRFLRRRYLAGEHTLPPEVLLNFVLHLALVNLAFNVLLTGTHERYLYHFYPYILLAWAGLRQYSRHFSNAMIAIVIFGAILYGAFVLGVLAGEITFQRVTLAHQVTALFHAGLLGYLSCVTLSYQNSSFFSAALASHSINIT